MLDDPNITMEEYIRLEEENARNRGNVFNWETAKYGMIWYDEDVHDLISIKNEFPAIAFNDSLKSGETLSCEPMVSSLNNEIDFKISFDDSDDEDYTTSLKILRMNLFIVYNDAPTSKSDLLTEPILSPQHINLNNETSLSEFDKEEQNVLYFNDLFPFNIIQPDDLKSEKDNDDNEVDIIQSSGDMALPPRDQRHQYLRYEGLHYTDADIVDFEMRLARIYMREVHKVHVFDFGGLPDLMAEGLSAMMLMEHKDAQGVSMFTSRAWRFGEAVTNLDTAGALQFQLGGARCRLSQRQFILALGLHAAEKMETVGFAGDFLGTAPSYTSIRDLILRLCHRLIACNIAGKSQAPKKVTVTDLFFLRGMDVGSVNVPYLLARYLRLFAARRKSGALISRGQFVARLAEHFGLLRKERLRGLTVIALALLVIDMAELVRLLICTINSCQPPPPAGGLYYRPQRLWETNANEECGEKLRQFITVLIRGLDREIDAEVRQFMHFAGDSSGGSSPASFPSRTDRGLHVIDGAITSEVETPHYEQCNKILPLLKLSDEDKKNEILHPYQNLKGFYKGVLNLGPYYIQDARTKEWFIRGHISMHEME
ncbi:hypothetical protein Tco_1247358 [Tanacetum coccineum]